MFIFEFSKFPRRNPPPDPPSEKYYIYYVYIIFFSPKGKTILFKKDN